MTRPAPIRVRVTAVLEAAGHAGMLSQDIAAAVGVTEKTLWAVIWYMVRDGLVGWWPDPHGRVANRRRYWLIAFKPASQPKPSGASGKEKRAAPVKVEAYTRPDGVRVLPHAPVYSRHQIAELPPGYQSALNPRECRDWARAVA
jgi:hypothetical protein